MCLGVCRRDVAYSAGVATRHFYISDTKLLSVSQLFDRLSDIHDAHYCYVVRSNWCRMRESNSHQRITKPLYCHCTNAALLVEDIGIEPITLPCKGSVFPLALIPQNLLPLASKPLCMILRSFQDLLYRHGTTVGAFLFLVLPHTLYVIYSTKVQPPLIGTSARI